MPRQARIVVPGSSHHVTQRGNYGQQVFFTDSDRLKYLALLRANAREHGLSVTAYCLMDNHVHLVAVPAQADSLAKALGSAHLAYAHYRHRISERKGHLWQNRFYSCPMDDAHTHNALAYVELNPVRAGIVRAPWEYRWSSAAAHCGTGADTSGLLDMRAWLAGMPRERWVETLREIARSKETIDRVRDSTRTGRPVGSDAYIDSLETRFGRKLRSTPRGRPKGSRDQNPRTRRG